jgi:hypothetical protein
MTAIHRVFVSIAATFLSTIQRTNLVQRKFADGAETDS